MTEIIKICARCEAEKPISEFHKKKGTHDGFDYYCKECKKILGREEYQRNKATYKKYAKKNKEKRRKRNKAWRDKNPDKMKFYRIKTKYGIGVDEYRKLLSEQDNCCCICGVDFSAAKPVVDHCHESGSIRGILCARCNVGIGMFRESIDSLSNAIIYLSRYN